MSRRRARELALQALFQVDVGRSDPETAIFQAFTREVEGDWSPAQLPEKDAAYARLLVQGAHEFREESDALIARYARDWSVERMAAVDRAILRLAIYEIIHQEDVPDGVVADEAVEMAKAYSSAESSKFINGILGSVIRGMKQGAESGNPPLSGH